MMVVQELDKTLFEGYVKPKATVVTGIVRGGILDPEMDWYETPQPKGAYFGYSPTPMLPHHSRDNRDPAVRVRDDDVSRRRPRASQRGGSTSS